MSNHRNPALFPFTLSNKNLIAISITTLLALTMTACTNSSTNPITGGTGSDAYTVNTTADTTDRTPGDGFCADQNNQCSLRAAIIESNTKKGPQSITIPALTITLNKTGTDDKAELGDLDITDEVSITGKSQAETIIDAGSIDRIFQVLTNGLTLSPSNPGKLTLENLTLRNGSSTDGGAIYATGILNVKNVSFFGNTASNSGGAINAQDSLNVNSVNITDCAFEKNTAGNGGAIYLDHDATLKGLSITRNTASKDGGGIYNQGNTVTLETSVLTGNISRGDGGAIHTVYGLGGSLSLSSSSLSDNHADLGNGGAIGVDVSKVTITSSTLEGNSAGDGGAIGASRSSQGRETLEMTNSTISGNRATNTGGGINVFTANITSSTIALNQAAAAKGGSLSTNGSITLKNSILSALTGGDCYLGANSLSPGSIITAGGNISSDATCSFGANDKTSTMAKLEPIANNGGLTRTHLISATSPALEWIDTNLCPSVDQRGVTRPQGEKCDAGAVERRAGATP
jgi:CSLREA domain-containing protein